MIKHSLEKIDKLIKERERPLPELMLKLYAFLLLFAKKLEQKSSEYLALQLYGDALRLFRKYLVDEPFKLTKITVFEISQSITTESFEHFSQIFDLRNRFLKQLISFGPTNAFGKKVASELSDIKWAKTMEVPLEAALLLKKQIQQKKGNISNLSEIASLMWYGSLKGEYLIHVDSFVQKLIPFCHQYFPMLDFIQEHSAHYLKELVDPEKKYYLTAYSCDQFFTRIRSAQMVTALWQASQDKFQPEPFVSESSMVIRLTADSIPDQIIGITGQKIILNQEQKDVKAAPGIMIGSAAQSDIVLKSKYISRKQMLIIEDRKSDKLKVSDSNKYNFSMVCLSQTNFTSLSYPIKIKAGVGLIFFAENVKYQIMNLQRVQCSIEQIPIDEDDKTLSILPGQKGPKHFRVFIQSVTLLILSGQDKEKEINFNKKQMNAGEDQGKHMKVFKQIFEFEDELYFKQGVRILCKTANEVVESRTSRKIRLKKGMQLFLEEYTIFIE